MTAVGETRSEDRRPNCPITGLPAKRRVQRISSDLLIGLWRASFGVATERQLGVVPSFSLWESRCGLAFFDPMIAGDAAFYDDLYVRLGKEGPWTTRHAEGFDYRRAAALVRPGDRVLDVGCGSAGFSRFAPQARYVGLDQSTVAGAAADVRHESIADHARLHPGEYDVVCSFHVIEHVTDPVSFAADMMRCLRPGGRLVLAVPAWPGAMTDVPNLALNGPPHHLTWWTENALRALAERLGAVVETAEVLPPSLRLRRIYWMGWAAPKLTGDRFFRHAWGWHFGLVWSWLAGLVCSFVFGRRLPGRPFELFLAARKPG